MGRFIVRLMTRPRHLLLVLLITALFLVAPQASQEAFSALWEAVWYVLTSIDFSRAHGA